MRFIEERFPGSEKFFLPLRSIAIGLRWRDCDGRFEARCEPGI
jgi:hypothetical protein